MKSRPLTPPPLFWFDYIVGPSGEASCCTGRAQVQMKATRPGEDLQCIVHVPLVAASAPLSSVTNVLKELAVLRISPCSRCTLCRWSCLRGVTVWEWKGNGQDEGDTAAEWLEQILGQPCRLLRYAGELQFPAACVLRGFPADCFTVFPASDRPAVHGAFSLPLTHGNLHRRTCSSFVCCGLCRCERSNVRGSVPTCPRPQGKAPLRYFAMIPQHDLTQLGGPSFSCTINEASASAFLVVAS